MKAREGPKGVHAKLKTVGKIWMMFRGRVAAVSYLNTVPLIYGIEHAGLLRAGLILSPPSRCVTAFRSGEADLALVPVGGIDGLSGYSIVTNYCIGASGPVRTVTLMCDGPLKEIRRVWLDGHSRTSALLVRILCEELWNITPQFLQLDDYSVIENAPDGDAFLLIGDKVFDYESRFANVHDLAVAWRRLTGLPFVFAVWIAREGTPPGALSALERSLEYGLSHIPEAISYYGHSGKPYAREYLTENIDFTLDEAKRSALALYLEKGRRFGPVEGPG